MAGPTRYIYRFASFVEGLDLVMYSGEIFALLGHNGAGKTTTLAMLCGLMPPTRGRCVIYGHDLLQEPAQALAPGGCWHSAG